MALTMIQREALRDAAELYAERHLMACGNAINHRACGLDVKASEAMERAKTYKSYAEALDALLEEA